MNRLRSALVLAAIAATSIASNSYAQSRDFGARRIVLDNGTGFELVLQPPVLTTSGTFTFPDPATTSGTFVMTASTGGQNIAGPLSISSGNSSLGVVSSGANDMVLVNGRDVVGSDLPFVVFSNNTGLSYGATTFGRMLRLDQSGVGFRDIGIDNLGNFFVTSPNSTAHAIDLSTGGDLNVVGNITLGGTVDGVDIANADASNVKLTGNQAVLGIKSIVNQTVWVPQTSTVTADNTALTITASSINVTSDDATAANRTFTIPNGTFDGQMLVIRERALASQLQDTGNVNLTADMDLGPGDTIMLTWMSALGVWLEVSRANN